MSDKELKGKFVVGKVVSNKMQKTIVVEVERRVKHPLYGKFIRRRTKLHAHDEKQICEIGNVVRIQESRPISKKKTWVLIDIISQ